ncbi:hypothetical protein LINPERHAP2_LOCUS25769 [Linum perenne]
MNSGSAPYIYSIEGQIFHRIGSLLPPEGQALSFLQLYIHDTDNEIMNWLNSISKDTKLRESILQELRNMLDEHNALVKVFRLQTRFHESSHLLLSRRLFQQYVVNAYAFVEAERLDWIKNNQVKLCYHYFQGLAYAFTRGDTNLENTGKHVILAASHTGSPRCKYENFQDAMAICRVVGYPDLFITFTCNSDWPKIHIMVNMIRHTEGKDPNRADVITRVFKLKLNQLILEINTKMIFGKLTAFVQAIEFQKRGLPHAHMLLFLSAEDKIHDDAFIDAVISAEIPDPIIDPLCYKVVENFMFHGPCGAAFPNAPCTTENKCTKHFPKSFCPQTCIDEDGFPRYRRSENDRVIVKSNDELDNRFVVPYNRYLLLRFNAHINVEFCNKSRSLTDFPGLATVDIDELFTSSNTLLAEELNHDYHALGSQLEIEFPKLNPEQRHAFDQIISSVYADQGNLFFVDGFGGTGKTFLWQVICLKLSTTSRKRMKFNSIDELIPTQPRRWALQVRVSRSWMAIHPFEDVVLHKGLLLLDAKGDDIWAEIPVSLLDIFTHLMVEQKSYTIHQFNVIAAPEEYRPTSNKFVIQFHALTTVEEIPDIPSIPYYKFTFIQETELSAGCETENPTVLLGDVLCTLSELYQNFQVELCLWNRFAAMMDEVLAAKGDKPLVLIATSVYIRLRNVQHSYAETFKFQKYASEVTTPVLNDPSDITKTLVVTIEEMNALIKESNNQESGEAKE